MSSLGLVMIDLDHPPIQEAATHFTPPRSQGQPYIYIFSPSNISANHYLPDDILSVWSKGVLFPSTVLDRVPPLARPCNMTDCICLYVLSQPNFLLWRGVNIYFTLRPGFGIIMLSTMTVYRSGLSVAEIWTRESYCWVSFVLNALNVDRY